MLEIEILTKDLTFKDNQSDGEKNEAKQEKIMIKQ